MFTIKKAFLFDIDGTLLFTGGAGRKALNRAFLNVHGITNALDGTSLSGKTDPQIYKDVISRFGSSPNVEKFKDRYFSFLREELPNFNGHGFVMPGTQPLLEHLTKQNDCIVGILTGNWRQGAELKLSYFGLGHYFSFGAYGDDGENRLQLPSAAKKDALKKYRDKIDSKTEYFIIGDTPRDIECANNSSCKSIAVATGEYSLNELEIHKPDFSFSDLLDIETFCIKVGIAPPNIKKYPNCDSFLKLINN